jgi:hypothetical protein
MRRLFLAALAAAVLLCPQAWAQALNIPNWAVNSTPAVSTQATASRAALTGNGRHVATNCSGSISTIAAQTNITLALRDGATGAGTVLWSETIICAINSPCVLSSGLIHATGSAATAMTCEWSGAPVATNFAVASLTGYDTHN